MRQFSCSKVVADPFFWGLIHGGIELERDDDYLRDLLLEMVTGDSWLHTSTLHGDGSGAHKRHFHILLLVDAGFMARVAQEGNQGQGGSYRITNDGHDFIALTRETEAWEATKAAMKSIKGASVQMLYRVAEGYARQKLVEMGVPIG